ESERKSRRFQACRELQLPAASLPDIHFGCETQSRLWTNLRRRQPLPEIRAAGYMPESAPSPASGFFEESLVPRLPAAFPKLAPEQFRTALPPRSKAIRTICKVAPRICESQTTSTPARSDTRPRAAGKSCTPSASEPALHRLFAESEIRCPRNPTADRASESRTEILPVRCRFPQQSAHEPSSSG